MAWANLLRPFLLVRVSLALAATIACVIGLVAARRWVTAEAHPLGSPERIRAERTAELVSALLGTAMVASAVSVLAFVVGAEHAHSQIRGAMCAYGVLASAPHGFFSLATGLFASAACAAWLALHRLDLALVAPVLTRTKLLALGAVLPAVAYDLVTALRFAFELDFTVVATCCSSGLGETTSIGFAEATRFPVALVALGAGVLAAGSAVALARVPSRGRALLTAIALVTFASSGVLAATNVVAPHAYGTPTHRCAFCLLGPLAHGIGFPLLAGLLLVLYAASALLALETARDLGGTATDAIERRIGRSTAVVVALSLALLVMPVLVHRLGTGAFVVRPW